MHTAPLTRDFALQVGNGGIPRRHLLHRCPVLGVHARRLARKALLLALQPSDDLALEGMQRKVTR